jgi:hypothetical protein
MIWFILGGTFTTHRPHVQKVIRHYLTYDLITIALAGAIAIWYHAVTFPPVYFKAASAIILLLMFVIDVLWHSARATPS